MSTENILKTGFTEFDEKVGLKVGQLVLVGGRPSMGKTALAMTMVNNICKEMDGGCIYFSMEMYKERFVNRLLKMNCQIENLDKVLTDEDWEKIGAASYKISEYNLLLDDSIGNTVEDMVKKTRERAGKAKVSLIVVDYLELMTGHGEVLKKEKAAEILRILKKLAEELQCTVLVVSQLARFESDRSDKRPTIDDFFSVDLEKAPVDEVLMLYRDEYYNEDSDRKGIAELHSFKPETGEEYTVELSFIRQYAVFES